jgi:hypothetical protein
LFNSVRGGVSESDRERIRNIAVIIGGYIALVLQAEGAKDCCDRMVDIVNKFMANDLLSDRQVGDVP